MSKFWSALSAIGVVEKVDPSAQVTEPVGAPNQQAVPTTIQVSTKTTNVAPPVDASRIAELDAASKTMLITAMQNDGAPLVEEVVDTLDTLQDAIPDERARYKAALKILVKRGHPTGAVLSDFDKCLGVLEANKRSFETDSKTQFDAKVGTKVRNVESLTSQIEAKNKDIEKLQQEIAELAVKRDDEQKGITLEQLKISQVQERFGLVYSAIRRDIEAKREKVAQHGQEI